MGEFSPLSHALGSIKGMGKVSAERSVVDKILRSWELVAGGLSVDVSVSYIRSSVLFLETSNPMWQMEFGFIKPMLLERIQKIVGSKTISDIRLALIDTTPPSGSGKSGGLDLPLESVIQLANRQRAGAGMALCNRCGDVYTEDGICVFCRCQV